MKHNVEVENCRSVKVEPGVKGETRVHFEGDVVVSVGDRRWRMRNCDFFGHTFEAVENAD